MATIADRRLVDRIKEQRRAKRGGAARRVRTPRDGAASSVASLLQLVAVHDRTPSRSAVRHERERAVRVALAGLKDDYREALVLRYGQDLAVAEIAARMNRSERAVHMLCSRALKKMRLALGHASQYLTRG